jgi:MFS family permease
MTPVPVDQNVRVDRRWPVISVLGVTRILAWGSSYYLPAVLAAPIAADTGWPLSWVVGGLSLGLLVAGLASPHIGSTIDRLGGRPVLAFSAVLIGLGQLGVGASTTLPVYIASWLVMGAGMGAGLYDAAFGTLGRLYGQGARSAIATLTLFGGFASTACWPLSAFLVETFGWRGACYTYAAIQIGISLPLYLFALPRETRAKTASITDELPEPTFGPSAMLIALLAITLTLAAFLSSTLSVHLLTILQDRGATLALAVGLGAIVGPSQVGARAIEMAIARWHHPIWTKLVSAASVTVGIGLL